MMLHLCVLYVDFIKYKVWLITWICLLQAPLITIFLGAHLQPGFPNTTLTLQRSLMKQFCGQGLQQPFPASGSKQQGDPSWFHHEKNVSDPSADFRGYSQDFWGQSWERRKSTTEKTVDLKKFRRLNAVFLKSWPLKKHLGSSAKSKKKTCRMHGFWLLCLFHPAIWHVSVIWMPRHPATQQALRNERIRTGNSIDSTSGKFSRIMKIWSPSLQMKFSSNLCMVSIPLEEQSFLQKCWVFPRVGVR